MDLEIQEAEENWEKVDPDCMSDRSDQEDTRHVLRTGNQILQDMCGEEEDEEI